MYKYIIILITLGIGTLIEFVNGDYSNVWIRILFTMLIISLIKDKYNDK